MLVLMGVHFWRIRKDGGLSRPIKYAGDKGRTNKWYAWPVLMWTELGILLGVIVAAILFIAFVADAPLLEQANPSFPENPAKSPWYFLGIQELVSYSAFAGGLLVPVLYLVFLFSIPYRDREDSMWENGFRGKQGRKMVLHSAAFTLIMVLIQLFVMIRYGGLRDWFPGISQWFVMLINPATITAALFIALAEMNQEKEGVHPDGSSGPFYLFLCGAGDLYRDRNLVSEDQTGSFSGLPASGRFNKSNT